MTAPRTCRACGAPIGGDVRWCLRCYEPVRELTPREPQLPPLPTVRQPTPEPVTSRWRRGPTTFGPVGRILLTAILALFAPWHGLVGFGSALGPLTLWYLLGYTLVAVLLLRHIWRREPVADPARGGEPPPFARLGQRFPSLRRRVPPVVVAGALGLLGLAALAAAWANLDAAGRYYLVAVGVAGGTGAVLVLWNDL